MIKLSDPAIGQEEIDAVTNVMKSGWLVQGKKVEEFEQALAKYIGVKNVVCCNGCTQAIHMTLVAMRKRTEKNKIITPDYSYPSVGVAIKQAGFEPVFCDINKKFYVAATDDIIKKIDDDTAAIMTHVPYGIPNDYDTVRMIARKYGLMYFDDAAPGIGAAYRECKVGSFADASFFSFHPVKVVTTGEGGAVATDDDALAEELRILRNHGRKGMTFYDFGFAYRMTDVQAAMGIEQLKKLDTSIAYRRKLARAYSNYLDLDDIQVIPMIPDFYWTVQRYVVQTKFRAQDCIDLLAKDGIESTIGTYAQSKQQIFNQPTPPNVEIAFNHAFCLPMHTRVSENDVKFVAETLNSVVHKLKSRN